MRPVGLLIVITLVPLVACGRSRDSAHATDTSSSLPVTIQAPRIVERLEIQGLKLIRFERSFPSSSPALGPGLTATAFYLEVEELPDPKFHQQVNFYLGPYSALEMDWDAIAAAFAQGEYPFDSARSEIVFWGKGILQVRWSFQSTAAYTSEWSQLAAVDLTTAQPIDASSLWADHLEFWRSLNAYLEPVRQEWIDVQSRRHPDEADLISELGSQLQFEPPAIDRPEFTENGLLFTLPSPLPHALAALEVPDLHVFLSWSELEPYLWEGSVLNRFVSPR